MILEKSKNIYKNQLQQLWSFHAMQYIICKLF